MKIFLARQPIFNKQQQVVAYELLYRSSLSNFFDGQNDDQATASVLTNAFLTIGIDTITDGKIGFVNFTDSLLRQQVATLFPSELLGIELAGAITVDEELLSICTDLKRQGYRIVVDDIVSDNDIMPLLRLADIVKIDFLNETREEQPAKLLRTFVSQGRLLAKRVEDRATFDRAVELGYSLFQGYFFAKPVVLSGREPCAHRMSYLNMLHELNRSDLDFDRLETIVSRDVSLSYKLLRYVNSPFFGLRSEITGIRHALTMLGLIKARQWLSLLVLCSMGSDKTEELIVNSLVRAKFFELLAPLTDHAEDADELFTMGLFSMVDALLDMQMADVMAELPLSTEIKNAILGKSSAYNDVYNLLLDYEQGNWPEVCKYLENVTLKDYELPKYFLQALKWSNQAFPR